MLFSAIAAALGVLGESALMRERFDHKQSGELQLDSIAGRLALRGRLVLIFPLFLMPLHAKFQLRVQPASGC